MSFNNSTISMEFTARTNRSYREDDKTYSTDFDTGRSWIHPTPHIRFYKDGGVSLHTTGRRDTPARSDLSRYGIDIELFGEIRGVFTTPSGDKIPRHWLRNPPSTVLLEGDRVYPLSYRSTAATSPMRNLPPAYKLANPVAVWQDRSMMPVCSALLTVHEQSKARRDEWMDLHGDSVKVARTLGAFSKGATSRCPSDVANLLRKLANKEELSTLHNVMLFMCSTAVINSGVMFLSAKAVEHEYLLINPS